MPLVVKDRVRETSTTTGTGTFTLAGAVTGYQAFSAVGDGNTTYYTIYLQGGNEWEVGIGTYTASGTTLSRDTILASSNAGSAVNFSAGTKDVFVTYPAGRSVWYDSATNVTLNALTLSGGTQNGVLYLNASKVTTSGSALTFDGTILNNTGAAPGIRTTLTGGLSYTTVAYDGVYATGTDLYLFAPTGKFVSIYANNAEQMRLTSTGVVIRQSSNSANTSVSLNTTIQNALTLEADGDLLVGTTTNTNSSKLVASGTISETVSSTQYLVASQFDIGTAANEIPLNQYLGNLAYQDAGSIAGQVGLSAGTAALPSLVSATDTDTGMWFPAANTLAWSTGGVQAVTVDSSGNLLLGGTSTTQLDGVFGQIIGSSSKTTAGIALETSAGAYLMYTDSSDALIFWDSGSNVERTRITSGGTFQTSLDASIYGVTVGRGAGAVATNTAVGASALAANTTGSDNTALGNGALYTNQGGARNTAVGSSNLRLNVSGVDNSAFGYGALDGTTGSYNTAVGSYALVSNTTASNNTAVGYQAGYSNTTGTNNAFFGRQAGYATTTGVAVTAIGDIAAYSNTTGQITAVGYAALTNNTTASANTGVGVAALRLNTTGAYNTALGDSALYSNTTASTNTAVGYQAGYSNTTGYGNDSFGTQAGYSYTTTNRNTSIGTYAGRYQTGYYNVFVGAEAGNGVNGSSTANTNVGIGTQALSGVTTGSNNVAIGGWTGGSPAALAVNTSGAQNIAIGSGALGNNTTASNNTAVGYQSLYISDPALTNATSLTSGNNGTVYTIISVGSTDFTAIGAASNTAGITFTKSGGTGTGTGTVKQNVDAKNTAIGYGSGSAITTGTKNTILGSYNGNQDGLDIRTSSNVIVLSDGDGNANFIVRRNSAGSYFLAGPTKSDPSGANYYSTVSADGADVQLILQRTGTGTGWAGIGASGESAFIVYGQGLTSVPFRVKQTDGTVILKDGATAATGTGITFPATQSASSDANTLDDYEEGTWTPAVRGALTAGTYELATAEGSYVKIGKQVTLTCRVVFASSITGGGTGYLQITGAPSFNNAAAAYGAVSQSGLDMTTNYTWLTASFISTSGTTILYLDENGDSVSSSDFPISGVTASDSIRFSITYIST